MNIRTNSVCVDVTFGGGGHSREILSRLGSKGHLYGFDQDEDAISNIPQDKRFTFVRSNFRYLKNFIKYYGEDEVDAILADLGVSSHHFDDEDRGFSFRFEDSDLDMRMNRKGNRTAAQILNNYPEEQLANIFYLYGELKQSRRIASVIVKTRKEKPYKKTGDLLNTLSRFVGK
jgi:16S rRNA (cytosine1402-N4)-methyltransferase